MPHEENQIFDSKSLKQLENIRNSLSESDLKCLKSKNTSPAEAMDLISSASGIDSKNIIDLMVKSLDDKELSPDESNLREKIGQTVVSIAKDQIEDCRLQPLNTSAKSNTPSTSPER